MSALNDRYWLDVAAHLRDAGCDGARVVAPREFAPLVPGAIAYERRLAAPVGRLEAVVVHKGLLHEVDEEWLDEVMTRHHPTFANEVFVVFEPRPRSGNLEDSPHYRALEVAIRTAADDGGFAPRPTNREERGLGGSVYLGDHRAITRTIHGHRMFVDTRDVSLAPHILMDGTWEPWITTVFESLLRPGMVVVDVGANIGHYAVLAAEAVGASGRVHAFEPQPDVADLLFSNLAVNGFASRSTVTVKAVSAHVGRAVFGRYRRHPGSSSLWGNEEEAAAWRDSLERVEVDCVTLDAHFAPESRVDLLRMDAEGAEGLIVQGAPRLLAENPDIRIVMEFAPRLLQASAPEGRPAAELFERLTGLGFRAEIITTAATLEPAGLDRLLASTHSDVLFRRD